MKVRTQNPYQNCYVRNKLRGQILRHCRTGPGQAGAYDSSNGLSCQHFLGEHRPAKKMNQINWKQLTKRRGLGLVTMAFGLLVLFSPIVMGEWVISLLGLLLIAAGLFQVV